MKNRGPRRRQPPGAILGPSMRRRSPWLRSLPRSRRPDDRHDGANPLSCPVDAVGGRKWRDRTPLARILPSVIGCHRRTRAREALRKSKDGPDLTGVEGGGREAGTCSLGKSESLVHAISSPPLIQINWPQMRAASQRLRRNDRRLALERAKRKGRRSSATVTLDCA
jgi:hypothetical protein